MWHLNSARGRGKGTATDLLSFATDVQFSSPSAAASIVAGRNAGGPLE